MIGTTAPGPFATFNRAAGASANRDKLALEALASLEERDKTIVAQWRRRIERARYEVDLAERRFEEVDPSNRLIATPSCPAPLPARLP
jgi:hypothetical protein